MLFLTNKITLINNALKATAFKDKRFYHGLFVDEVALTAATQGTDGLQYLPVYYDTNAKEYKYIGLDDNYPLIVYHKHISTSYSGDAHDKGEVNRMQMVVFGMLDALGIDADTLGALVVTGMPEEILKSAYPNVPMMIDGITLVDVNPDTQANFNRECRNTPYQMGPQHALLSFNYTIESTYNRKCFDVCGCLTT